MLSSVVCKLYDLSLWCDERSPLFKSLPPQSMVTPLEDWWVDTNVFRLTVNRLTVNSLLLDMKLSIRGVSFPSDTQN